MKKIGVVAGVVGAGVLAGLGWLFAPAAVVARRIPVTLVWILHVAIVGWVLVMAYHWTANEFSTPAIPESLKVSNDAKAQSQAAESSLDVARAQLTKSRQHEADYHARLNARLTATQPEGTCATIPPPPSGKCIDNPTPILTPLKVGDPIPQGACIGENCPYNLFAAHTGRDIEIVIFSTPKNNIATPSDIASLLGVDNSEFTKVHRVTGTMPRLIVLWEWDEHVGDWQVQDMTGHSIYGTDHHRTDAIWGIDKVIRAYQRGEWGSFNYN